MSPFLKHQSHPPATPALAKRVWKGQSRPSVRKVARALTQAGFQVHYTTVARWKSQDWVEQGTDRLDAARANLEAAMPVVTNDPTTKAADLVDRRQDKRRLEELSDAELLRAAARAALISAALVGR